jgi:nucleoid-associated protein YgaU
VITTGGDRYDTLAYQFYKDSSLWWIIATANNYNRDNLAIKPGVQLRIPADKDGTIQEYHRINNIR